MVGKKTPITLSPFIFLLCLLFQNKEGSANISGARDCDLSSICHIECDTFECPKADTLVFNENGDIQGTGNIGGELVPLQSVSSLPAPRVLGKPKSVTFVKMDYDTYDQFTKDSQLRMRCYYSVNGKGVELQSEKKRFIYKGSGKCCIVGCSHGQQPGRECYGVCAGCTPGTCISPMKKNKTSP